MDRRNHIVVRRGTKRDSNPFLMLISAFARFVRHKPPDAAAKRRLVRDIFSKRLLNLFVATDGKRVVGYVLYFFTYSSFHGKANLFIEDLFVLEDYRGSGVGRLLFMKCAQEAVTNKCGGMDWLVLKWNGKAMGFYHKLGAKRLKDTHTYRLPLDKLKQITKNSR